MDTFDIESLKFTLGAGEIARQGEFALADPSNGDVVAGKSATGLNLLGTFRTSLPLLGDGVKDVEVVKVGYVLAANSLTNPVTQVFSTCYVENEYTVGSLATGHSAAGKVLKIDSRGVTVQIVPGF